MTEVTFWGELTKKMHQSTTAHFKGKEISHSLSIYKNVYSSILKRHKNTADTDTDVQPPQES